MLHVEPLFYSSYMCTFMLSSGEVVTLQGILDSLAPADIADSIKMKA